MLNARLRLGCTVLFLLCCPACQSGMFDWVPSPFPERERTSYPTPPKRMAALEQLAETAAEKSPAEREQVTSQLAAQVQVEKDPLIRRQLLRTMAAYETDTSGIVLRAALNDPDAVTRVIACQLAAERKDQLAVTELAALVQSDTSVDVRIAAARALGRFEDARIVPSLGAALNDRDPALQLAAIDSLRATTGEDFGNDVVAWRQFVRGETPEKPTPTLADRLWGLSPF